MGAAVGSEAGAGSESEAGAEAEVPLPMAPLAPSLLFFLFSPSAALPAYHRAASAESRRGRRRGRWLRLIRGRIGFGFESEFGPPDRVRIGLVYGIVWLTWLS